MPQRRTHECPDVLYVFHQRVHGTIVRIPTCLPTAHVPKREIIGKNLQATLASIRALCGPDHDSIDPHVVSAPACLYVFADCAIRSILASRALKAKLVLYNRSSMVPTVGILG